MATLRTYGALALVVLLSPPLAAVPMLQPPFDADYTLVDLGVAADVHVPYGGLTFVPDDPDAIVIAGWAQTVSGYLYAMGVTRDATNTIDGFAGPAVPLADAYGVGGGLGYGPGGVLFYVGHTNVIGQVKPGSATTDKSVSLSAITAWRPGGMVIVPPGYGDEGKLKFGSVATGEWWTLTLVADGMGTYDVTDAVSGPAISGGPAGLTYVPAGSPGFPTSNLVVGEQTVGTVSAYQIDGSSNPVVATRREIVTGVNSPQGVARDPLTGDLLFTSYYGTVYIVRAAPVPPPTTTTTSITSPTSSSSSSTSTTTSNTTSTSSSTTTTAPTTTSTTVSTTTATTIPITSTSTTATTTTSPSTTTTIPGGCLRSASFGSIACRVDALLALVRASSDLGTLHQGFVARLERAHQAVVDAETACAAGQRGKARDALETVGRQMVLIRTRLRTRRARRIVPGVLRAQITADTRDMSADVRTLRAALRCGTASPSEPLRPPPRGARDRDGGVACRDAGPAVAGEATRRSFAAT